MYVFSTGPDGIRAELQVSCGSESHPTIVLQWPDYLPLQSHHPAQLPRINSSHVFRRSSTNAAGASAAIAYTRHETSEHRIHLFRAQSNISPQGQTTGPHQPRCALSSSSIQLSADRRPPRLNYREQSFSDMRIRPGETFRTGTCDGVVDGWDI